MWEHRVCKYDVTSASLNLKGWGSEVRPRGVCCYETRTLAPNNCRKSLVITRVNRQLATVVFKRIVEYNTCQKRERRHSVRIYRQEHSKGNAAETLLRRTHSIYMPASVGCLGLQVTTTGKVRDGRGRCWAPCRRQRPVQTCPKLT